MNPQTIQNPEVVPTNSSTFSDRDMLQDALYTVKHLAHNYETAVKEASHKELYDLFFDQLTNLSQLHRELFDHMFKKGWYVLTPSAATDIATATTQLQQTIQKLQ